MSRFSEVQKNPSARRKLREFLRQSDNRTCADCGAPDPKWALRIKSTKSAPSFQASLSRRIMDTFCTKSTPSTTVQTTVIPSNLNPEWNEILMLSVPQDYGTVKLQVYDYDTFSTDDIMGEAEIDLQALINSAVAYGDPEMFGNMQIGKWLKSHDNALIHDSTVNILDGKVKQNVFLKLQNVECGELQLELEWLSLEQ
ncbi:Probable ADP-ribosylation factor GTPase-activating protein AGD13 [Linum perenne]